MELKEIGEFGFIKRFANKFDEFIADDEMGIGDDCAILPIDDKECYVVSTDLLVEDVHFKRNEIDSSELGHKSLAVNLSDIAAMGAAPRFSFLSIAVPDSMSVESLDQFMVGYHALSKKYGVPLMGGDTTKSPDKLIINVAVVGQGKRDDMRLRSMAEEGDVICVSGHLGESAAGLKFVLEHHRRDDLALYMIAKHHCPEPRITEGLWLASQKGVNAMMDISDGVASDLLHILEASNKAAILHVDKIPASKQLQKLCQQKQWSEHVFTMAGGEDYELLFTVKASAFKQISEDFMMQFNKPLFAIGSVLQGDPKIEWQDKGQVVLRDDKGFNHFES